MRRARILTFTLVIVLLIVSGRLFLNAPIAKIELGAETIGHDIFGLWNLTNTIIASWMAMGVLLLIAFLATRKMELVPRRRLQNLVEAAVEWSFGFVESVAGKERGRRFYPLVATIFFFILIANWLGLLPVFGPIGRVELAEVYVEERIEEVIDDNDDFKGEDDKHKLIEAYLEGTLAQGGPQQARLAGQIRTELGNNSKKLLLFDDWGGTPVLPVGFRVKKEVGAQQWVLSQQIQEELRHPLTPERVDALREKVHGLRLEDEAAVEGLLEKLNPEQSKAFLEDLNEELGLEDGKVAGVLVPYFRSVNTDLMNTLALALVAMFMVELWGIRAHGFIGYTGRFFDLKSLVKGKPIDFFVSILEGISEIARVISFTFRLFGNVLAGEILILVFLFLFPLLFGLFPFFFELLFGFIQAAIFAVLTLLFATLATEVHEAATKQHASETRE